MSHSKNRWLLSIFFLLMFFIQHFSSSILNAQSVNDSKHVLIGLDSDYLHIGFDSQNGQLVEFIDRVNSQNFIDKKNKNHNLWQLELWDGGNLTPSDAHHFRWEIRDHFSMELVWDQFGIESSPNLRVLVSVQLHKDEPMSAWDMVVEQRGKVRFESIVFPRICKISPLGKNERLAVPRFMGELAKDPRNIFSGSGTKYHRTWIYPGELAFQCLALYEQNGPGLYLASDDTAAFRKGFVIFSDDTMNLGYEMVHYSENPHLMGDGYDLPYHCLIGTFQGDWITAAKRYRTWGVKQRWARESRLKMGLVPEWLLETGMWVWNRGRANSVLPPAMALHQALELPVSVFWHWWHGGPYDTSFPEYLPPRDGTEAFKTALRQAQKEGVRSIVYMNQRLWCMQTKSWEMEGAGKYATKNRDGTFRVSKPCVFDRQPCAAMCISTPFWRSKYADLTQEVLRGYGVNGIYMDQAVRSIPCYDPAHGHPLGGGNYWMKGFKKLEEDIRRRAQPEILLAGEHVCETWFPSLDLFLTLQISEERYKKPGGDGWQVIPFFPAVYHPYALTYGSYSSLTIPPYDEFWPEAYTPEKSLELLDEKYNQQFRLEQARAFAWGMQPTVANFYPSQFSERGEQIAYMMDLAHVRQKVLKYLLYGTFERSPVIEIPAVDLELSRLSIYAGRMDGETSWKTHSPAMIISTWQADDGDLAIVLASIVNKTLAVNFDIDPTEYGFTGEGRIKRIDAIGESPLGEFDREAVHLDLKLPPLGVWVLELSTEF